MKILLTTLLLTFTLSLKATHTLTYYVYIETEYTQGPWTRAGLLDASQYKYLAPVVYDDLFGSDETELINKLLFRLKEKNPDSYNWSYSIQVQGDTVLITPKGVLNNIETIKNEITATLCFNNYKAVGININGQAQVLTINDLTLPFFDLVTNQTQAEKTTDPVRMKENKVTQLITPPSDNHKTVNSWLILSVALNILLVILLIKKKA